MSPSVAGSNYLDKSHRYTGMGAPALPIALLLSKRRRAGSAREAPGDETTGWFSLIRQDSRVKRIVFWPMAIMSPSDSCFSITGSPLTSVPLVLPRSLIQKKPFRTSILPW
jgi:hypothetical protein